MSSWWRKTDAITFGITLYHCGLYEVKSTVQNQGSYKDVQPPTSADPNSCRSYARSPRSRFGRGGFGVARVPGSVRDGLVGAEHVAAAETRADHRRLRH